MLDRPRNPQFIAYYRAVALLTTTLVFVQAVLAGRSLFVDPDAIDIHEIVANGLAVVVVAQMLLAVAAGFTASLRVPIWTAGLVALTVAQTGLGYTGRDNSDIAALHVPVGVLLFGLSMLVAMLAIIDNEDDAL